MVTALSPPFDPLLIQYELLMVEEPPILVESAVVTVLCIEVSRFLKLLVSLISLKKFLIS